LARGLDGSGRALGLVDTVGGLSMRDNGMGRFLEAMAAFLAEHGFPAMVSGDAVVWYVQGQRQAARTWGQVWALQGY
jgi:hypothetical protein